MKFYVVAIALFLSACQAQTKTVYVPQEVKVPISEPCQTQTPAAPSWNVKALPKTSTFPQRTQAIIADLELSKGYNKELLAALKSCQ